MTGVGWSAFLQLGKVFRIVPWGSPSPLHRPVREKVMEGFTMATLLPLPSPWGGLLSSPWKHSVVPGGKSWKCEPPFSAQPLIASYSAYSHLSKRLLNSSYQFFGILHQVLVASFLWMHLCLQASEELFALWPLFSDESRKVMDFQVVHIFLVVRMGMTTFKALYIITKELISPLPKMGVCSMFVWAWSPGH